MFKNRLGKYLSIFLNEITYCYETSYVHHKSADFRKQYIRFDVNRYIKNLWRLFKRRLFGVSYIHFEVSKQTLNLPLNRPRVLHIIRNLAFGGSQKIVFDLVSFLSNKYHQAVLTGYIPRLCSYSGLEYMVSNSTKEIRDYLYDFSPHIVHIHYWELDEWMKDVIDILRELKTSLKFKIIENCNNPIPPFDCDEIDKYIFVSNFVRNLQQPPQPSNKTAIIYPGVNMEEFNFNINNKDPYTIGMVYRLTDDKISKDTIDILIKLCKEIPKLTIHIVGHGPNFRHYAKRCRKAGVRNQFIFPGVIEYSQLSKYYEKFHLYLAPVHSESYGVVVPYAMAKGVYVIAYDTQCLEELLGTKEYLSTSEQDLLFKVKRFMDPPCNDISIIKDNRKRAESLFSLEKMLMDYSKIYDDLLNNTSQNLYNPLKNEDV